MTYTYTYTAAELQQHHDTVDDGEKNGFAIAPNLIKTSRLVVQGVDSEPLPTNGTNTNYTAGVEVAFGCVAGTNIVNLTNDTVGDGGNWTAASGTIYFEVDIGPGRTIGDYFGSVMQADGTQLYAGDTAGITLTENSGKARLTVDFAQVSFSVWGISEQRGKLEYVTTDDIERNLYQSIAYNDYTSERSANITYQNNTGAAFYVSVLSNSGVNNIKINIDVDGSRVSTSSWGGASNANCAAVALVPIGSTYEVSVLNTTIAAWRETR